MRFGKSFILLLLILILIALTGVATALDYEDKPYIIVSFYGSNYFQRGDEKTLILSIYNNAKNEKIEYDQSNPYEAMFFSGREKHALYSLQHKFKA